MNRISHPLAILKGYQPDKRFKVKITGTNVTGELYVSATDLESAYKLVKDMNFTIVSIVEQESTSQPSKVL